MPYCCGRVINIRIRPLVAVFVGHLVAVFVGHLSMTYIGSWVTIYGFDLILVVGIMAA